MPPRVSPVFFAWAIGNSRNRKNWQLTTLKQTRNVLYLLTVMACDRPPEVVVDPLEIKFAGNVFENCPLLGKEHVKN
jgi:hypothetical protein